MARFTPSSPQDLAILKAGMCPDCGTGVFQGMTACKACGLTFEGYTHELPAPRAKAGAPAAPQQAAPPAPPGQPPSQPRPPPSGPPPSAPGGPRALSLEDIDMMERGLPAHIYPLTDAEGPDVYRFAPHPLLGSALQRAAIVVMADAAICDEPMVLMGHPPVISHVSRQVLNRRRTEAAVFDDPEELIQSRAGPRSAAIPGSDVIATAGGAFNVGVAAASVPTPRGAPAPKTSGQPPRAPGIGKPLTLEEIMAIEFPVLARQPHSAAEGPDVEDGSPDPLLGASRIRGSNTVMADAAVTDEPLVLLGYPAVMSHVARLGINVRRSQTAITDDVATLLQRPRTSAPSAPPGGAPHTSPASAGSGRRVDPEATAFIDNSAVLAAAAYAREQEVAEQARRRQGSVAGHGGARPLDEK